MAKKHDVTTLFTKINCFQVVLFKQGWTAFSSLSNSSRYISLSSTSSSKVTEKQLLVGLFSVRRSQS